MATLRSTAHGAAPARAGIARGAGLEENARAQGFAAAGLRDYEVRGMLLGTFYRDLSKPRATRVERKEGGQS